MRSSGRRASQDAGAWGGQLISLSDLMAGLLFVFIVIVLVFAYKLNKATEAREDAVKEFRSTQAIRRNMLETIRENLEKHGITDIEINPETGVLSLREGILFPSGSTDLSIGGKEALSILALVLNDVLPCYAGSYDSVRLPGCADGLANGSLEAVFVEGHTDSIPVSGANRYRDNWNLSTARAIAVFSEMTLRQPSLDALKNAASQPLFSISGYSDRRPYSGDRRSNLTENGRALNRRIDVRFVMTYPRDPEAVSATNKELDAQPRR